MVDAALEKKMDTPSVIEALKTSGDAIPHVSLFTDGACSGNPGPGGWGVVFILGEYLEDSKDTMIEDLFGGEGATTNNRMEMMAAIQGLKALPKRCRVDLYTDSTYVRDGLKTWMPNWKKNGWMTADKKPVKNKDLWEELDSLQTKHDITWHWVKGHAGHPMNERADDLARSAVVMQAFKKI